MTTSTNPNSTHSAEAAALGFAYQTLYALLTLLKQIGDDAAVSVEQLDDVVLTTGAETLLHQLKNALVAQPTPNTVKSRALWRTMKVWADALPALSLSQTSFHLVTVAGIASGDPLEVLSTRDGDRTALVVAMTNEATRVLAEREKARANGNLLPHAQRVDGCQAFLDLTEANRALLLRRTFIVAHAPTVRDIEAEVASQLTLVLPEHRPQLARRLVEWWDRQVLYSLCGARPRVIARAELQAAFSALAAELEDRVLVPEFENLNPPSDYQPDGMLARQIGLVDGKQSDHSKAIREEWRARAQRAGWINASPAMAAELGDYDLVLAEAWHDRHARMAEDCSALDDSAQRTAGLALLRWTHDAAPTTVRPFTHDWSAAYLVRGSYQVLAIDLRVGWHPNFRTLLGGR